MTNPSMQKKIQAELGRRWLRQSAQGRALARVWAAQSSVWPFVFCRCSDWQGAAAPALRQTPAALSGGLHPRDLPTLLLRPLHYSSLVRPPYSAFLPLAISFLAMTPGSLITLASGLVCPIPSKHDQTMPISRDSHAPDLCSHSHPTNTLSPVRLDSLYPISMIQQASNFVYVGPSTWNAFYPPLWLLASYLSQGQF